MVGVPGRSKGCNTCIQRKIKCDQETPLCGNCRKSNRLCTGYKRRLGYVLSRDVSGANLAESHQDTIVTYQGRWRKTRPPQASLATYQAADPPPTWANSNSPVSLRLSRRVSENTAWQQQLHYIYLKTNMPDEMLDESNSKFGVSRNWLVQLQEVDIQSPALKTSIAAFFAAEVGRKNNDMNLVLQSRSMYVDGLRLFQQALKNPQSRLSDETLATCMALSRYELMESPPGMRSAYLTHQNGAMMLLELRGPDASASPLGQSLFVSLRTTAVLMVGRPEYRSDSFLSRPEWNERPWKLVPKTPYDELIDALFDFQTIFQKFQEVAHETNLTVLRDGFRDTISKCLKVDSTMRGLYRKFQKSVSGLLYWPELSTLESYLDDPKVGKVFPVSFHFSVFFVAQLVTTYWSAMMAVHYLLMYTYDKLAIIESSTLSTSHTDSLLRSQEHSNEWQTMARNICQSVEYFLQDKMGVFGPLAAYTELRACKGCLEGGPGDFSREIAWISDFIERIRKKVGFPVNNLLGD